MSFGKLRIGDIFNIEKGSLQSTKCVPGKYNFITAAEGWKTHKEFTHNCEALLFAAAASGSLGRTHYVNGKFVGSDLCLILTPKDSKNYPLDLKFYHSVFNTFRKEIVSKTKSGTSKEAISIGKFSEYELQYFDLDHQKYWKDKLGKINYEKDDLEKELSFQLIILSKLHQQILRDAVHGKLVVQDPNDEPASVLLEKIKQEKEKLTKEGKLKKQKPLPPIEEAEIPFVIPKGWVWVRLSELCTHIGSGSTPSGGNYSKDGIPFFRSQNIYDDELNLNDIKFISSTMNTKMKSTIVKANDLLLNITGGSIGRCAFVPDSIKIGNVSQHVCIIRSILMNSRFVHKIILSPYFQNMILDSTTGAGREGLPKYNLEKFLIPLAPLSEQTRIVSKVEALLEICDNLEKETLQNQKLSQQLLQSALKEALEPKGN